MIVPKTVAMLLFLLLTSLNFQHSYSIVGGRNNVCTNFDDYKRADVSENCYFDSDWYLETPELIKKYTSVFESYKITTEDGYTLTMFRIPRKNAKNAILLQHPLTGNSRTWVMRGNESLAFYLWRAGYDIWLNNQRGTLFSEKHSKYRITDSRFWDFSFHEIAFYDISSQIKLIKSKIDKNLKISLIGHSMGSTCSLLYASLRPEEARNSINAVIPMATGAYFKSAPTIVKTLVPFEGILKTIILDLLKLGNVLPFLPLLPVSRFLFRAFPNLLKAFSIWTSSFCGWTPKEIDPIMINFDFFIIVKNFSWKILLHYLQWIKSETKLQMFDYGKRKNLRIYKSEEPPLYPLENISTPIFLISSYNDSLTTLEDDELLYEQLPKKAKIYPPLKVYGLNHADYVLGKHPEEIYYEKLLKFLDDIAK